MKLDDLEERVQTRKDLAAFVSAMLADLEANPDDWENPTLDRFLEAMSAWINDMPGYFKNNDLPEPAQPDWRLFATILLAARLYE